MPQYSRILILLVDDRPVSFARPVILDGNRYSVPQVKTRVDDDRTIPLEKYFDVKWIATAEEAREFHDRWCSVAALEPSLIGNCGLVFDILCYDYALTGDGESVAQRRLPAELTNAVSPLPAIRSAMTDLGVDLPPASESPPPPSGGQDNDSFGCFAAGLLLSAFSSAPCVPVAVTRKRPERTVGTEAEFFEWLLERRAGQTIREKGMTDEWDDLLPKAVVHLRHRILELADAHIISPSIGDLLGLAKCIPIADAAIRLRSSYGVRALPIGGLFIDHPNPDVAAGAAADWAEAMLRAVFRNGNHENYCAGKSLAEQYLDASVTVEHEDRYRLSWLASQQHRTASEEAEFCKLCSGYGLDASASSVARGSADIQIPSGQRWPHLAKAVSDSITVRWAVLLLMVRTEMELRHGKDTIVDLLKAVKEEFAGDGLEIARDFIFTLLGASEAEYYARLWERPTDKSVCRIPAPRLATPHDIYLRMDPLPETLIAFSDRPEDPYSTIRQKLKRLGDKTRSGWHTLGLSIEDILSGRPNSAHAKTHGVIPGEGHLLREYAHEIHYAEEKWPVWLRDAK